MGMGPGGFLQYVNLHAHTHYSIQDGLAEPLEYVRRAAEWGVPAVSITDHGNCNAFGHFYQSANQFNIKPIFGIEFYYVPSITDWRFRYNQAEEIKDKQAKAAEMKSLRRRYHLVVWAKNEIGFRNLNNLIYESYKPENYYYKPRVDRDLLAKYREGLMCSTACLGGEIPQLLSNMMVPEAVQAVDWFRQTFGEDFYLETQFNEIPDQKIVNRHLISFSKEFKIKIVCTGDTHFLDREHERAHKSLLLIGARETWADYHRTKKKYPEGIQNLTEEQRKDECWVATSHAEGLHYRSYDEMWEMCHKYMDIKKIQFESFAVNTLEVADKIEKFEIDKEIKLKDPIPDIRNKTLHLKNICEESLTKKGLGSIKYFERLNFELNVIKEKKLANYFLAVKDIVDDARKDMLVGCGRGSGAGSLVNYLLGITEIDPVRFGLLFERFLAVDRPDYPDIDIDFEDNDEIKHRLLSRHGTDAACISSYSKFDLSGLLKDLARVYGVWNFKELNALTKVVRMELGDLVKKNDLELFEKNSPTLRAFLEKYPELAGDMRVLFGKIRHMGKHAAGIVICDDLPSKQPMVFLNKVPQTSLTEGVTDRTLAQFGYIKFDILGLMTLKIIRQACQLAGITYKKIHPDNINLEDENVFEFVFKNKNLVGLFQFDTDSILKMIDQVKPDSFEDLVAINALFRPGPLQSGVAFEYGDRKRGVKGYNFYGSDIVQEILGPTYGILCYQEQVMQLCHRLGKLSMGEANYIRKVFSKKLDTPEVQEYLERMRSEFVRGAVENGVTERVGNEIWGLIGLHVSYSFNRSHSLSYSMIAFQCAWLKTYHLVEFYTALLNNESPDRYRKIISEVRRNKIQVLPLDLEKSGADFAFEGNKIYWGFSHINGFGPKVSQELLRVRKIFREQGKSIKDWDTFISSGDCNWRVLNKNIVIKLLKIGCFRVKRVVKGKKVKVALRAMVDAYGLFKRPAKLEKFWSIFESLEWDHHREMKFEEKRDNELGAYKINLVYIPFMAKVSVNGREVDRWQIIREKFEEGKLGGFEDNVSWKVVVFNGLSAKKDKRGRKMGFVQMEDFRGVIQDGVIFSGEYKKLRLKIRRDGVFCVKGYWDRSFVVDNIVDLDLLKI